MQNMFYTIWAVCLLLAFPIAAEEAFEERLDTPRTIGLFGPRKDSPEEQLAYAKRTGEQGKTRKAVRQHRALVRRWPGSPEAAQSQLSMAQLLRERGRDEQAFDAYEHLLENYPQTVEHDVVLGEMLEIARAVMDHRVLRWFGLPGMASPQRAVPVFETILRYGPRWRKAYEVQYLIGCAWELDKKFEEAVPAYEIVQFRYPDSPRAGDAAARRVICLVEISRRAPNDERSLQEAWNAAVLFGQNFSGSKHAQTIEALRVDLLRRRTENAWKKAEFYDKTTHRPISAIKSYEQFIRQFPGSEWTPRAQRRIEELKATTELPTHE